jgi:hypothetical protein
LEKERALKEILRLFNKLAHKKYRTVFYETLLALRASTQSGFRAGPSFFAGLDAVEQRARKREEASRSPSHP